MFGVVVCPQYIGVDDFLSMNSCEPMFWMACVLALVVMLRGYSLRTWWIGCDVNLVIAVIPDTQGEVSQKYESVEIVGHMDDPYAMPFEHKNIYLLRGRRGSAPFHWADERFYF